MISSRPRGNSREPALSGVVKRIVLVEDHPNDATFIEVMLGQCRESYYLKRYDRIREIDRDLEIDLVLLGMRSGEGPDRILELSDHLGTIPIVVLVSSDLEEVTRECIRAGAQDGLPKADLNPRMLDRVLSNTLARWKTSQTLIDRVEVLNKLVMYDPLTECQNRRGFERTLESEQHRATRQDLPTAALLIDVDDFKAINSNYQFSGGDFILQTIAKRIQDSVRPSDSVGRIGGDEFMVLLPNTTEPGAIAVAERIRASIAKPIELNHQLVNVTVSLGVTKLSKDILTIKGVHKEVETKLFEAKKSGKNRVAGDISKNLPYKSQWVDEPVDPRKTAFDFEMEKTVVTAPTQYSMIKGITKDNS